MPIHVKRAPLSAMTHASRPLLGPYMRQSRLCRGRPVSTRCNLGRLTPTWYTSRRTPKGPRSRTRRRGVGAVPHSPPCLHPSCTRASIASILARVRRKVHNADPSDTQIGAIIGAPRDRRTSCTTHGVQCHRQTPHTPSMPLHMLARTPSWQPASHPAPRQRRRRMQ